MTAISTAFVVLAMIFCHIVDDYYLQGVLANLKQKKWWSENAPSKLYKHDYVIALLMHAFSWSFMIMLPIAVYCGFHVGSAYVAATIVNTIIHAFVDNLKANKLCINLIADQTAHLIQIAVTAIIFLA